MGCVELQPDMSDTGYSWAYLNPMPDGRLMQYHIEIGTINDITVIEE